MPSGLSNLVGRKDTPAIWAQGYLYASVSKHSSVVQGVGKRVIGLGRGLQSLYGKSLPSAKEWADLSTAQKIADRLGMATAFGAPSYYAYTKLRPQRRRAPAQMYQPSYNVGAYTLPVQ